jgi:N-acetylneuraminic acid mutarotase
MTAPKRTLPRWAPEHHGAPFRLFRAAPLLLFVLLASCGDTPTQPMAGGLPASAPDLAVASNTWATRAALPGTERVGLTTAEVRNAAGQSVAYAIGGRSLTGGSLGRVQAYNVATNTWSEKAPMPIAAYSTNGAAVIDGKIYVSGGVTRDKFFRREFHMYDPATDTWTRKQDMPEQTWGGLTGVIGGKMYVLTCIVEEDCYIDFRPLQLFRYDPATDQWTELASSPLQQRHPMGGFIGGKLYATGATPPIAGSNGVLSVYDPSTNQWASRTPLAPGRQPGASVTLGAKLYVIGGSNVNPDGGLTQVRTVSVYDPATDRWTERAPLPADRAGFSATKVVRDGQARIEVVGGPRPGNNLQYTP